YLAKRTGAPTAIGEHVVHVQALWKDTYDWPSFPADWSQWDRLFKHGEQFRVGEVAAQVAPPRHGPCGTLRSMVRPCPSLSTSSRSR
ncbi:MAG: hypothetical protein JO110_04535, partial [Acetobacteraceae bacterium]|nr:hypothetical protein [Acetobacteraceae bacterium]